MSAIGRGGALLRAQPCSAVSSRQSFRPLAKAAQRNPLCLRHLSNLRQLSSDKELFTSTTFSSPSPLLTPLRSALLPSHFQPSPFPSRPFSSQSVRLSQDRQSKAPKDDTDQVKDGKPSAKAEGKEEPNTEKANENEESQEKKEGAGEEEADGKKKQDAPPPPPHGDKSPWQVFTDTLKSEFQKSKEWNEGTKQLASSANEFSQNETIQKMRKGYESASGAASSTTAKVLKSTGGAIGQSAYWTWNTAPVKGIRAGANATGRGLERVTRPLRETEAYKSVSNVIDDGSSSRYGGWTEREERRKRRENRDVEESLRTGRDPRRVEKMEEDVEAGTNITVHKDAAWKEQWRDFRDSSKLMQGIFSLKSTYNESENPLISTARSISDRVAGFFAENETATVIKKFREMDPNFQLEPFLQDMREYILPEVLDAYVKGDTEILKLWLSAAQYQVYSALMHQYTTAGLKSDGRILDIRNVDVLSARLLDPGEIPVFIITCRTQEVHVYKNAKSGELAAGMEDRVQQVTYAIGVTRIPEDVNNPETRGWRLIELQKSGRDYI